MVEQLLLKDHKRRPAIQDTMEMRAMKEKMDKFGYSPDDYKLA